MKRAILPLAILAIAVSALAQDSVTLRYNLKQAKVYRYSIGMKMTMDGGPVNMDMKMNMISCLKVKEIADGFIDTVNYFEFFKMGTSQPGMEQMLGGQESEIKKLRITQQFDFFGNAKGDPTITGGAIAGQIGMVNGMTGNTALGLILPKEPITLGKTWDQVIDLNKAMGAGLGGATSKDPLKITYTVKSFGDYKGRKAVTLGMVFKADLSMGTPGAEGAEGPKVGIALNGSGDVIVDQATGLTLKSANTIGINISMAGMPAGSPDKMTQNLKIETELLAPASL